MKCVICGKEIEKSSYWHKVICSRECFRIDFWNDTVECKDRFLIINGESYYVGDEKRNGCMRGYGGQYFKIRKFDGTIIETTNLWSQGEVPEDFKDKLPNNAEWFKEEQK